MALNDVPSLLYLVETILCYFATVLFVWWAIWEYKNNRVVPEIVYFLIMLLFLTLGYSAQTSFEARTMFTQKIVYEDFLTSIRWQTRVLPKIIIELLIVSVLVNRVYNTLIKK